jgi:hypothetical protein
VVLPDVVPFGCAEKFIRLVGQEEGFRVDLVGSRIRAVWNPANVTSVEARSMDDLPCRAGPAVLGGETMYHAPLYAHKVSLEGRPWVK